MTFFNVFAILIAIAALLNYLNHRYLKLPSRIGLLLSSLVISIGLIAAGHFRPELLKAAGHTLERFDFRGFLLDGVLCFLLFASALRVNLEGILKQKKTVITLGGTVLATFFTGAAIWACLGRLGMPVPFLYCLLFGAIISPTDPVAIIGILRDTGVPEKLEAKITGEALFNDGVGVVLFMIVLQIVSGESDAPVTEGLLLFFKETLGGIVIGLAAGYVTYLLLKSIDYYPVEIMLTLALSMGSYAVANAMGGSGPFAVVIAGLLIGNHGRMFAMSPQTCQYLGNFWDVFDEILNALLFFLIGAEIILLKYKPDYAIAGLLAIVIIPLARWASIAPPLTLLGIWEKFSPNAIKILTWGGLRGGIAVALALSVPTGPYRNLILAMTYAVVVFSILVQGLTIEPLIRRWNRSEH